MTRLKLEEKLLLLEVFERHYALLGHEPAKHDVFYTHAMWQEEVEYGPRLSLTSWFGCAWGGAVEMRFRRALEALRRKELLILDRADGARSANVRLTEAGESLAVELGAKVPEKA